MNDAAKFSDPWHESIMYESENKLHKKRKERRKVDYKNEDKY